MQTAGEEWCFTTCCTAKHKLIMLRSMAALFFFHCPSPVAVMTFKPGVFNVTMCLACCYNAPLLLDICHTQTLSSHHQLTQSILPALHLLPSSSFPLCAPCINSLSHLLPFLPPLLSLHLTLSGPPQRQMCWGGLQGEESAPSLLYL